MDNRTIEEVRNNEIKLIKEIEILKMQNKKYKEIISIASYLFDRLDVWLEPQEFLKLKKIEKVLEEVNK